jgi:hypothetical protein
MRARFAKFRGPAGIRTRVAGSEDQQDDPGYPTGPQLKSGCSYKECLEISCRRVYVLSDSSGVLHFLSIISIQMPLGSFMNAILLVPSTYGSFAISTPSPFILLMNLSISSTLNAM